MTTDWFVLDHEHRLDGTELERRIGAKAASLNRAIRSLGLPVPPGVVFPVGMSADDIGLRLPEAIASLEARTGRVFGAVESSLAVSVRSGAPTSMMGALTTVLDVGGADSRPHDPWGELRRAVALVEASWWGQPAVAYRAAEGLSDAGGTAVIVQAMVDGAADARSGSGVIGSGSANLAGPAFSARPAKPVDSAEPAEPVDQPDLVNPADRRVARQRYGEFALGMRGDALMSGEMVPLSLDELAGVDPVTASEVAALADRVDRQLTASWQLEVTIERGTVWVLQLRTPCDEGPPPAPDRGRPSDEHSGERLGSCEGYGLPASPGRVEGAAAFTLEQVEDLCDKGLPVVLLRPYTSPADLPLIQHSDGLVTVVGGLTSHAAVVARRWGIPAIVGVKGLVVGEHSTTLHDQPISAGDRVLVDGDIGRLDLL